MDENMYVARASLLQNFSNRYGAFFCARGAPDDTLLRFFRCYVRNSDSVCTFFR
jgi:hypothetical protein